MSTEDRSWVDRLLKVSLPTGPTADAIRGDLAQEFRTRRQGGRLSASVWYATQALSVVLWAAFDRARGRPWGGRQLASPAQPGGGKGRYRREGEFVSAALGTVGLAIRRIGRAPGFAASVVLILALGLGANVVMFGVVDRLLLSPPKHVVNADEVHLLHVVRERINVSGPFREGVAVSQIITYPDYQDFLAVEAFSGVAAYSRVTERTVGRGDVVDRARVVGVTPNLFPLLGVNPTLGRFFTVGDDDLVDDPTTVLADEYWDRRYGRDPGVLGRTIDVGTTSLTIIGVAPAGFTGAELTPVDIWVPMSQSLAVRRIESRSTFWVQAVARLAAGATVEAAEAEATARHRGGRAEMIALDRYDPEAAVTVAPIIAARGPTPTTESKVALWLVGVSLAALLIACFNVANLLLARSIQTRQQVSVRLALGISRRRLIGELVTESLVLAMLAAGAALLVARLLGDTLHQVLLPHVAFTDVVPGGRLLGFTLVATLAVVLLSGLVPALRATQVELADALKARDRGVAATGSKMGIALLVGQVALSVVLLIGAGLFVRSFGEAQELDLGFDSESVVVATLQFNEPVERTEFRVVHERALGGVRRLPGVHSAALTATVPFQSILLLGFRVPGLDSIPRDQSGGPSWNKVSSGYFEAMGLTILEGRGFEPADDADDAPPVAIVTESMARAIWPAGKALGACMLFGNPTEEGPCTEVVGIVENHRRMELVENDPRFQYFLNQFHPALSPIEPETLVVGTTGAAEALVDLIRDEVAAASTQIRFVNAVPMSNYLEPQMRSWRLGASMLTAFGLLALIVAAWGLYSVLAFDVALRRRELGIRSALGANVARLVRLVLGRAVWVVLAGVGIGSFASWATSRLVTPLLFRVSATNPPIYALVGVTLLLVSVLAGSFPAWRATRVDPREALQAD